MQSFPSWTNQPTDLQTRATGTQLPRGCHSVEQPSESCHSIRTSLICQRFLERFFTRSFGFRSTKARTVPPRLFAVLVGILFLLAASVSAASWAVLSEGCLQVGCRIKLLPIIVRQFLKPRYNNRIDATKDFHPDLPSASVPVSSGWLQLSCGTPFPAFRSPIEAQPPEPSSYNQSAGMLPAPRHIPASSFLIFRPAFLPSRVYDTPVAFPFALDFTGTDWTNSRTRFITPRLSVLSQMRRVWETSFRQMSFMYSQ